MAVAVLSLSVPIQAAAQCRGPSLAADGANVLISSQTSTGLLGVTGVTSGWNSVAIPQSSGKSHFVRSKITKSERPELTSAKTIVSGGRALSSTIEFDEVMAPLALM